jgi:hypothetical protein
MHYFSPAMFMRESANSRLLSDSCVLHKDDIRLYSYYREGHHVIPQAWQAVWWPEFNNGDAVMHKDLLAPDGQAVAYGHYTAIKAVWDPRLAPCCPTGHRNVHYLLVAMMKKWQASFQDQRAQTEDWIEACKRAVVSDMHNAAYVVSPAEAAMAAQAMIRWNQWGGDLRTLTSRKLYGYA